MSFTSSMKYLTMAYSNNIKQLQNKQKTTWNEALRPKLFFL